MPDLFLSYARDDQDVARRFAEGLESEGFSVWWDQALNPGEAFDQVTEEALAAASAVIVLWSKTSVSSRWVRAEATQANASNRLLPVMIEPCTRPIMFELTHTADLSRWKGNRDDAVWQAFVGSVRRFVQRRSQSDASGVPALAPQVIEPRPTLRERAARLAAGVRAAGNSLGQLLRLYGARLAFALIGAAIAALVALQLRPQLQREVTRFTIELPSLVDSLALSPDGRRIVYSAGGQLWSRRLDQDVATQIPGGELGVLPFFSPGGGSVAFFVITGDTARNQLKAFDFGSEGVRVLSGFRDVPGAYGSWGNDGHLIIGLANGDSLSRVASVGGVPEPIMQRGDSLSIRWPELLPGSDWLLFTLSGDGGEGGEASIGAQNLVTGQRKVVVQQGQHARYLPSGHLLYVRNGTLYAVAFDAKRAAARGREVPVVQGVLTNDTIGYAAFAVSSGGSLVYQSGGTIGQSSVLRSVARVSHRGEPVGLSSEARMYSSPRVSPDGSKVALEVIDTDRRMHIWVLDVKTGGATQLSFGGDEDRFPVWTSDSREVLYTSRRGKDFAIWRKAADGSGEAQQVLRGTDVLVATDVRGSKLIYQDRGAGEERDLFTVDLGENAKPQVLLSTPDDEVGARISPDGNWLAYVLTPGRGGTPDRRIYVRPYPNAAGGGQRVISDGQGVGPIWSPKGDQIYYIQTGGAIPLMVAQMEATPTSITPTVRRQLFSLAERYDMTRIEGRFGYGTIYDIMPGTGEIIAVVLGRLNSSGSGDEVSQVDRPKLNVVLNWGEELKRLVPVE